MFLWGRTQKLLLGATVLWGGEIVLPPLPHAIQLLGKERKKASPGEKPFPALEPALLNVLVASSVLRFFTRLKGYMETDS